MPAIHAWFRFMPNMYQETHVLVGKAIHSLNWRAKWLNCSELHWVNTLTHRCTVTSSGSRSTIAKAEGLRVF